MVNQSTKRGIQSLKVGMRVMGTKQQQKLISALEILNDYEIAARKANQPYKEPLKSIIEELYTKQGFMVPAMMPGQAAAAETLTSIIQIKINNGNEKIGELEQTTIQKLKNLLN